MKIGILTFHSANNYGAKLQAFALMHYLNSIGCNAEIINYRPLLFEKQNHWFGEGIYKNKKIHQIIIDIVKWSKYGLYRYKRFSAFKKFEEKYFRLSSSLSLHSLSQYDAYIFGSDQIWSKSILGLIDPYYIADFPFEKGSRKYIAYAPSIEKKEMSEDVKDTLRTALARFDFVSVREDVVRDFLQPVTDKIIEKVLDPTLLLNKADWNGFAGVRLISKPYVVFYQVRQDPESLKRAKEIANLKKCKLICLISHIHGKQDNRYSTLSPKDFVNVIKYAEAVVTSSFHGVAFSVIFEKELYALSLGDGRDERVRTLLTSISLQDRIFSNDVSFSQTKKLDYRAPKLLLNELRDLSKQYLYQALDLG